MMNPDFDTISHLAGGTPRQKQAHAVLIKYVILEDLKSYTPILVGTIPINIDIEGSDLDVICEYHDKAQFTGHLQTLFSSFTEFKLTEATINGQETILANFMADGFEIEIFGQQIPVKQQYGYRHMIIEHELLQRKGEAFRQEIISLKKQGYKTEPAFAKALDLTGNAYEELLNIDIKQF